MWRKMDNEKTWDSIRKYWFNQQVKVFISALPGSMEVDVIEPYSLLLLKIEIQSGFYRYHKVKFLIHIPSNFPIYVSF